MKTCPILLWFVLTCAAAQAQFDYTTDNGKITITGGCSGGALVIPAMIDGLQVTSIGDLAFLRCFTVTEIIIPNSVTSIGHSAFKGCISLTEIIIPNSVTSIGHSAFRDCSSLTEIIIPNSVTSIGHSAFWGCISLSEIIIPNSATSIGYAPFGACTSLTAIEVDALNPNYSSREGVLFSKNQDTLIQYPAAKAGSYLIPNSVTSIGNYAFLNSSSLTSVTIGNGVTSIGSSVFGRCASLSSVTIPDSVTSIRSHAFFKCTSLTSVNFEGNRVTSIGSYAFIGCTSLTSVIIPDSVTSIGEGAFRSCRSLTEITIGNSVTSIDYGAFGDCTSLTGIEVDARNRVYSSVEGVFFSKNQETLIQYPAAKAGSYLIPNSVTSIGDEAFDGCTSLTEITIPNSVTNIGERAFFGCSSLTEIIIPEGVTSIEDEAFVSCTSLIAIEVDALNPNYSSLEGVLFSKNQDTLIQYPATKAGSYLIPDSVISIGDRAFSRCSGLTEIIIPSGVTSIGERTFSGCTSLTEIIIPNGVTSIRQGAFSYCSSLTEIIIPTSLTSIERHAFDGCTSLIAFEVDTLNPEYSSLEGVLFNKIQDTLIHYPVGKAGSYLIPNSVTTIGNWAFSGCSNLSSVTIGNTVTRIGWDAFSYCTSLTRVIIGNSVTSIGLGAFRYCTSLTSVTIPRSLTSIWQGLFWDCPNLTSLYFEGNAPVFYAGYRGVFDTSSAVILYHRREATGWGQNNGGRPTALWIDLPDYEEWIQPSDLPPDSTETDDPDQDDMNNYEEMLAGTNPTDGSSLLMFDSEPRLENLTDEDKTPIERTEHALYVRSVPGKTYAVQWAEFPTGPWNVDKVVTATTTQTRFVFDKPQGQSYYRVILEQ